MDKINLSKIFEGFDENLIVTGITTDSRKISEGVLFIALKGENFNGEDFVEDAITKGATAAIVSKNFSKVTAK